MKNNVETIYNVVVGTAGHIDHGKSALVQSLTGIDPDRLPEEKERGLTIDLGFAPLKLESGLRVGVIDVPGHERLVKNMVAGATGIDLVILVVAADDGVMPQTEEHVAIMDLLGIQHGIVAMTKVDAVDADMRELVREDIEESLQTSFLKDAPFYEVSSITGEGIEELLAGLHDALEKVAPRDTKGVFRMPIQRVFSAKGFGTVVTGVPVCGQTQIGAKLEIVPLGQVGRVRGIHAYKEATNLARAGHSSAINLTDVDYRRVKRGMVLTEPNYFRPSQMFEARYRYLPNNKRPLRHQSPIRLHVGTAEALGRVYLLENKFLEPGEESFVQFRLDEPLVAVPGDRFVVRSYSPAVTIGGGEILDRSQWRLKTGKNYVLENLRTKSEALQDRDTFLVSTVMSAGYNALSEKEIAVLAGLSVEEAKDEIDRLVGEGQLLRTERGALILASESLSQAKKQTLCAAEEFFSKNPYRLTMEKLQVKKSLKAQDAFFLQLLEHLQKEGVITESTGRLRFRDFGPSLTAEDESMKETIAQALVEQSFTPPTPSELAATHGWNTTATENMATLLEEEGALIRVRDGILFHRTAIEAAKKQLRAHCAEHGSMTAGDAKNVLGSTRKYGIPLLEYFDQIGFTVRRGDRREIRD